MSDTPNIGTPRASIRELSKVALEANADALAFANVVYNLCDHIVAVAAQMNPSGAESKKLLAAVQVARDRMKAIGK